jgi:general secretion pathway protein F
VKNLIVHIELSRFSHALAILLKSGVEIINSIHMSVQAMGNVFLRRRFSEVAGRLKKGESLHHALQDVDLFPRIAVHMIEVGEETGKLPEILEELSTLYMEKFRTAMKRLISLLEPAIISIVGIVIGFIVISLVSAIMSMNDIRF